MDMKQSIGKSVSKNTVLGVICRVLLMVLSFVSRSVFVHFLSSTYLGINGLYTSILSVLTMADMGVNTVMLYVLFEPLANGDEVRVASLVSYFKKIFMGIAGAIFALGTLLIPILPYIVSENTLSYGELVGYYIIFLTDTVLSYFGSYKSTLLIADQKGYYVNIITVASNLMRVIIQIAVLWLTHSFICYLIIMLLGTGINNIILTIAANHYYPILKDRNRRVDVSYVKPVLIEKTKSVFLYRVASTLTETTDNILISTMIGTIVVGYYSNYSVITTSLFAFINVLSQAFMAGVGNYSVNATNQEKKQTFYRMILIYFFIGATVLCGMLCVTNDLVLFWLRQKQYVLGYDFVAVISIRLFFDIIISPDWVFREAQGLFNEAKTIRIWCAVLNLILSIIFGKIWGLIGIIAATTVAKILTTVWFEPKIICSAVFKESTGEYWKTWTKLILLTIFAIAVTVPVSFYLNGFITHLLLRFLVKGCLCVIVVTAAFYTFTVLDKQYADVPQIIIRKLLRKR